MSIENTDKGVLGAAATGVGATGVAGMFSNKGLVISLILATIVVAWAVWYAASKKRKDK